MDRDAMDMTDPGYRDLTRRLEAFADLRLSPSVTATARMRGVVMQAALARAAVVAAGGASDVVGPPRGTISSDRRGAAWRAWRRPAAALLAASLTVGLLAGTAFAAQPGGPLYAARIWAEMVNLPADPVARAAAEATRLDARLQEAQQASTAGDISATDAALAAYSTIVVEAVDGSAGDSAASAAIEVAVTRHLIVLTLLVDTVPAAAREAVEHALASSTRALDDIDHPGSDSVDPSHPAHPIAPGPGNDHAGAPGTGADGPDRTADPAKGPAPQKSAAPTRTGGQPKARDPDKPAGGPPSPAPVKTHKPSDPPGGGSNQVGGDKANQ